MLTTGDMVNLIFGKDSSGCVERVFCTDQCSVSWGAFAVCILPHPAPIAGLAIAGLGGLLYLGRYLWIKKTRVECDECGKMFAPLRMGKDLFCDKCMKKFEREKRKERSQEQD